MSTQRGLGKSGKLVKRAPAAKPPAAIQTRNDTNRSADSRSSVKVPEENATPSLPVTENSDPRLVIKDLQEQLLSLTSKNEKLRKELLKQKGEADAAAAAFEAERKNLHAAANAASARISNLTGEVSALENQLKKFLQEKEDMVRQVRDAQFQAQAAERRIKEVDELHRHSDTMQQRANGTVSALKAEASLLGEELTISVAEAEERKLLLTQANTEVNDLREKVKQQANVIRKLKLQSDPTVYQKLRDEAVMYKTRLEELEKQLAARPAPLATTNDEDVATPSITSIQVTTTEAATTEDSPMVKTLRSNIARQKTALLKLHAEKKELLIRQKSLEEECARNAQSSGDVDEVYHKMEVMAADNLHYMDKCIELRRLLEQLTDKNISLEAVNKQSGSPSRHTTDQVPRETSHAALNQVTAHLRRQLEVATARIQHLEATATATARARAEEEQTENPYETMITENAQLLAAREQLLEDKTKLEERLAREQTRNADWLEELQSLRTEQAEMTHEIQTLLKEKEEALRELQAVKSDQELRAHTSAAKTAAVEGIAGQLAANLEKMERELLERHTAVATQLGQVRQEQENDRARWDIERATLVKKIKTLTTKLRADPQHTQQLVSPTVSPVGSPTNGASPSGPMVEAPRLLGTPTAPYTPEGPLRGTPSTPQARPPLTYVPEGTPNLPVPALGGDVERQSSRPGDVSVAGRDMPVSQLISERQAALQALAAARAEIGSLQNALGNVRGMLGANNSVNLTAEQVEELIQANGALASENKSLIADIDMEREELYFRIEQEKSQLQRMSAQNTELVSRLNASLSMHMSPAKGAWPMTPDRGAVMNSSGLHAPFMAAMEDPASLPDAVAALTAQIAAQEAYIASLQQHNAALELDLNGRMAYYGKLEGEVQGLREYVRANGVAGGEDRQTIHDLNHVIAVQRADVSTVEGQLTQQRMVTRQAVEVIEGRCRALEARCAAQEIDLEASNEARRRAEAETTHLRESMGKVQGMADMARTVDVERASLLEGLVSQQQRCAELENALQEYALAVKQAHDTVRVFEMREQQWQQEKADIAAEREDLLKRMQAGAQDFLTIRRRKVAVEEQLQQQSQNDAAVIARLQGELADLQDQQSRSVERVAADARGALQNVTTHASNTIRRESEQRAQAERDREQLADAYTQAERHLAEATTFSVRQASEIGGLRDEIVRLRAVAVAGERATAEAIAAQQAHRDTLDRVAKLEATLANKRQEAHSVERQLFEAEEQVATLTTERDAALAAINKTRNQLMASERLPARDGVSAAERRASSAKTSPTGAHHYVPDVATSNGQGVMKRMSGGGQPSSTGVRLSTGVPASWPEHGFPNEMEDLSARVHDARAAINARLEHAPVPVEVSEADQRAVMFAEAKRAMDELHAVQLTADDDRTIAGAVQGEGSTVVALQSALAMEMRRSMLVTRKYERASALLLEAIKRFVGAEAQFAANGGAVSAAGREELAERCRELEVAWAEERQEAFRLRERVGSLQQQLESTAGASPRGTDEALRARVRTLEQDVRLREDAVTDLSRRLRDQQDETRVLRQQASHQNDELQAARHELVNISQRTGDPQGWNGDGRMRAALEAQVHALQRRCEDQDLALQRAAETSMRASDAEHAREDVLRRHEAQATQMLVETDALRRRLAACDEQIGALRVENARLHGLERGVREASERSRHNESDWNAERARFMEEAAKATAERQQLMNRAQAATHEQLVSSKRIDILIAALDEKSKSEEALTAQLQSAQENLAALMERYSALMASARGHPHAQSTHHPDMRDRGASHDNFVAELRAQMAAEREAHEQERRALMAKMDEDAVVHAQMRRAKEDLETRYRSHMRVDEAEVTRLQREVQGIRRRMKSPEVNTSTYSPNHLSNSSA